MVVVHQNTAALVLVIITLILQGAGMAVRIQWVNAHEMTHPLNGDS
jgi:hypothetical protein